MADPELTRFERWAVALGRFTNESPRGKWLQERFLRNVTYNWVRPTLAHRMFVDGLDELVAMNPDRGVLLVSNHRSFFDQYAILLACYTGGTERWVKRLYFPVRANFFYERPLGVLVNLAVGGGVMYPPIFRQTERTALNDDALDRIVKVLGEPGNLVGVHPEGTRGKGPDPYTFLPAQPGVGKMALLARPIVVPCFINGLGNDFVRGVKLNYQSGGRREQACIAVLGAPIDYSDLAAGKPRPALYKRTADRFMQEVGKLSERERALRAAIERGDIGDDDRGWLSNRTPPSHPSNGVP